MIAPTRPPWNAHSSLAGEWEVESRSRSNRQPQYMQVNCWVKIVLSTALTPWFMLGRHTALA